MYRYVQVVNVRGPDLILAPQNGGRLCHGGPDRLKF